MYLCYHHVSVYIRGLVYLSLRLAYCYFEKSTVPQDSHTVT